MGDLIVLEEGQAQVRRKGRPTLYTQAIAEAICDHIRKGVTKRAACALQDINEETFRLWSDTREDFIQMLARAEAEAETYYTESMYRGAGSVAGSVDWRAGESWLKRRRRADYGDTLDVRKLDDTTILRMLQASQSDQAAITEDGQPARISGADDL